MKYYNLFFIISVLIAGPIQDASKQYIIEQFPINTKIVMHTLQLENKIKSKIQILAKQKFYLDKLYYWNISNNDSTIAYAFLDNVKGKTMPITFMVILNINGNVKNTTIIKYREGYGGEVSNERWLAQFGHYNPDSTFKVGKDIDAITGATISTNSISKGVYKITLLYPMIKEQLQ